MPLVSGARSHAWGAGMRLGACALSFVVLAAASDPRAAALVRQYSHRIWRVQDGLPQNRIQAISQTPDGYLWIGTSEGLVRFDGARFFLFDRANTPAFTDDSILSLYPSREGGIWIGTESGGLLYYHNGSFQALGAQDGITNGFVRALYEDSKGTLWIGTDRGFFRRRDGKIKRLDAQGEIPVTAVVGLAEDSSGRIWVAGGIGVLVVEGETVRRFLPDHPALNGLRAISRARDGRLWLLSSDGLRRIENGALIVDHGLDQVSPVSLCEERNGDLWIGTLGEGLVLLRRSGELIPLREPGVLPDNSVSALFEDREENLWVGTQDGLLRLSRKRILTLNSTDGIADDNVVTIYEDHQGDLLLITVTGAVYRYSHGHVSRMPLPAAISENRARLVYRDTKGDLWFGTATSGAIRLSQGRATVYTTREGLRNNAVRQFYEDRQGQLWIALGSGLSRWDGHQFHNYYVEDGLAYGSVRVVMEDRGGDIIVGTDGGLNRIHQGKFVPDAAFQKLRGEKVWAIHEDPTGTLWAGTRGGGLFRIRDGQVNRITTRDGLGSNVIYRLLEDDNGKLWMSSPAGVFASARAELNRIADGGAGPAAVVPYGVAEGLESSQMNGGAGSAGCRASTGELWFPSVKGAVRIDPKQIRVTHPSPVLIESMTVDEQPIPLSGEIRIPPGHGKLAIEYTACSMLSSDRIRFRYQLEGFDPDWTTADSHRTAYYTNLPPGRYRFRVIAMDGAAPREKSEATIRFFWRPYFHQTAWFYGMCAAISVLLIFGGMRFYARQTNARYGVLLSERTRLAREMHDTVIQGCVGVSTLLEAASGFQPTDSSRMKTLVDQARSQIRLTLDEARQAVWDLRHARLDGDVTCILQDFASQLSAEKGIPIEVDFETPPPPLEEPTLRGILLVAREAIRNAANHACPQHIRIRMSFESGEACMEVIDDGRGFAPSPDRAGAQGHFGILGMRERIEQLGGSFLLNSSPGRGTSVVARLPLARR